MSTALTTISAGVGLLRNALELGQKFGPGAVDAGKKLVRGAFAPLRVDHVSTGERTLVPRVVGDATWEMVALADVSLVNLDDNLADITSLGARLVGGGKVDVWAPGLVLNAPPSAVTAWKGYESKLVLGGVQVRWLAGSPTFTEGHGFPLVIPGHSESRIRLAFLLDRVVGDDTPVKLLLRCQRRGDLVERPIQGELSFTRRVPPEESRAGFDQITGYPTWISDDPTMLTEYYGDDMISGGYSRTAYQRGS